MAAGVRVFILGCLTVLCNGYTNFENQPCVSARLSTVYTHLNHTVNLTCSFWSNNLNWTTPSNVSVFKHSGVLSIHPPVRTGYYSCSSGPCAHLFSLRTCPTSVTPVPFYINQTVLTLNCSLRGPKITWIYNRTRFAVFDIDSQSASGNVPQHLHKYLLTHVSNFNTLKLYSPFPEDIFTCEAGDCTQSFELYYHPPPKPVFPFLRIATPFPAAKRNVNITVTIVIASIVLFLCFFIFYFCLFRQSCCRNPLTLIPYTRPPTRATGLYFSESTSNLFSSA